MSPWRKGLYAEIAKLEVSGKVLDLGGSRKSGYHELVKGNPIITVVNMDESTLHADPGFDLKFDLEEPFPLENEAYDVVAAFNVLEHVFHYQNLLNESCRVLKKGGRLIVGVPFMIQIHPSPHDYWRYSVETLRLILGEAGFKEIEITAVGNGPFTASAQIMNNALSFNWLRIVVSVKTRILDKIASRFKGRSNGASFVGEPFKNKSVGRGEINKLAEEYPLGYFVTAKK